MQSSAVNQLMNEHRSGPQMGSNDSTSPFYSKPRFCTFSHRSREVVERRQRNNPRGYFVDLRMYIVLGFVCAAQYRVHSIGRGSYNHRAREVMQTSGNKNPRMRFRNICGGTIHGRKVHDF